MALIKKIKALDMSFTPALDYARDMFLMSFYLRGVSFIDIPFLKKSDLNNGIITYSRRKTGQQLNVKQETRKLIESFGKNESEYLLPIITDDVGDAERQYENAYYRINRNLQKVGKMIDLETKLTLYAAHQAWASIVLANHVAVQR